MSGIFFTAAAKAKVSPFLLMAVCYVESGHKNVINRYDNGSPSFGVCQVKKGTAEMVGVKGDLMNPKLNALAAAKYLRLQLDRYGNERHAIAAYNSGSLIIDKDGKIKNKKYVDKVLKHKDFFLKGGK